MLTMERICYCICLYYLEVTCDHIRLHFNRSSIN